MFQDLNLFQTAIATARHAGAQQSVIAQNIANADTPGYRAKEISPFEQLVGSGSQASMRTTRAGHLGQQSAQALTYSTRFTDSEPSPNGNSVSIEEEMLKSVSVARDHTRALAIYRHGMTVLRTALGR